MVDFEAISTKIVEQAILYAPKVILAIITLLIGLWIIRIISRLTDKRMSKHKIDASLRHFLTSLVSILLKVMLIITVISMFGVQMTSFIAVLGAAGLAIGLALQGSLANFAGGVLILLFKPFKVDDFIEAQGYMGKVAKIQIFNTILKTTDNKTVIIPNGPLSNNSIINYSTEDQRRVDLTFGIGYSDDIAKARDVMNGVISGDNRILKDPAHQILVSELADSSVNFSVRVWVKTDDYWGVFFDMTERVKLEFDKNNISIPFPQTDVHLIKEQPQGDVPA